MNIFLGILSGLSAFFGVVVFGSASGAIHEIEALILLLIAAVFFGTLVISRKLATLEGVK